MRRQAVMMADHATYRDVMKKTHDVGRLRFFSPLMAACNGLVQASPAISADAGKATLLGRVADRCMSLRTSRT